MQHDGSNDPPPRVLCEARCVRAKHTRVAVDCRYAKNVISASENRAQAQCIASPATLRAGQPVRGLKLRGASRDAGLAASRAFSDGEWSMVQTVAEGLEWSCGWEPAAVQRLRFVLDFAYATD